MKKDGNKIKIKNREIMVDFFISLYGTFVNDRKKYMKRVFLPDLYLA